MTLKIINMCYMFPKCYEINTTEKSVIKSAFKEKLVHTFQNFSNNTSDRVYLDERRTMFLESLKLYVMHNIRSHPFKYDELLFSFKNLYKFHHHLKPVRS
jgi:hypothetical protein